MGIQIADLTLGEWTTYSIGGEQTNPITTVHDGRVEAPKDVLLYVRNDDAAKEYSTIILDFVDYTYPDDIEGSESGWSVKVSLGSLQPSEVEWAAITAGDPLSVPDISGIGSEAFWYRVTSPRGLNVGLKVDIALKLTYIESTV